MHKLTCQINVIMLIFGMTCVEYYVVKDFIIKKLINYLLTNSILNDECIVGDACDNLRCACRMQVEVTQVLP